MKRWVRILFVWWFMCGLQKIGPFAEQESCNKIRGELRANGSGLGWITSCWQEVRWDDGEPDD